MLGAAGAESAQRRPAAGAGAAGTEAEAHLHGPGETVRPSSCWQKEAAGFQGQLLPSSTRFMGRELGAKRGLQPMGEASLEAVQMVLCGGDGGPSPGAVTEPFPRWRLWAARRAVWGERGRGFCP